MNLFSNLMNRVPPRDEDPPAPPPRSLAPFDTFHKFYQLDLELKLLIWREAFHGFAITSRDLPPPDANLFPFDMGLFIKDDFHRQNLYPTTEPTLIKIRIKFTPLFIARRPLPGRRFVRGSPYIRRHIDLKFSMFTPNLDYDPARMMRQLDRESKMLYETYKPRFLQLGATGPKIFFNPERDFIEMDEITLFLLWYYDRLTPEGETTDLIGFDEIRTLQLGTPTFRFPQGLPPRKTFNGIKDLRLCGRRVLGSVVFPEDSDPDPEVEQGNGMQRFSPYFQSMAAILLYISGQADEDPKYHTFPDRYRLAWTEEVDKKAFHMTGLAVRFYQ